MRDRSDWMLNPTLFQRIRRRFPELEIDLFASRLSFQLPRFFSWRPDPLAEATDAFLQDWKGLCAYAMEPHRANPVESGGTGSRPISTNSPSLALATLVPQTSQSTGLQPLLINQQEEVMVKVWGGSLPQISPPLAVWPISGNTTLTREFREKLPNSSSHHGDKSQLSHMIPSVKDGSAGALNGMSIPFQDL